ncbi:MAG: four-carbon acid sugar kinase family protein [Spirochaetaceae bacterium]|jgi:uncharacterized protein YgbK (DUF1537 family)|nr:four-carbon acid sugar kinase family protein [Spirochaetaceae bacterium]
MIQCVVVADDLTGANAVGVLMTKVNYRTYSITDGEKLDVKKLADCECVVYPTDSRSIPAGEAYERVYKATLALKSGDVRVYTKRIDTTLRGNLGSETDGMLDALGGDRVAMVVPCFPSSNRINVGGYLLVHGIPLHKTEVALDPRNPVHTPLCAELYGAQSKYGTASILIADLMKGQDAVSEKIKCLAAQGMRNLIFDAVTEEDIDLIAGAVIKSGVPFIAVDPGPFTASLSRKTIPVRSGEKRNRIFVAVGSVNAVARRQVDYFLGSRDSFNVYMETAEFLEGEQRRRKEIKRVVSELLSNCGPFDVCSAVGRGIIPERRVPFEPYAEKYHCTTGELSDLINESIAEITYEVMSSDKGFRGMYTCGGDITVAVCKRMKNTALRLLGEVLPLASYGEIVGGDQEGLKIVTKGGMVGDADAIVLCVRYLKEKLAV